MSIISNSSAGLTAARFGAVGNGDETTELQLAIDECANGVLQLDGSKTYTAGSLSINSPITIFGNGAKIVSTNTNQSALVGYSSNVAIHDLEIDGNDDARNGINIQPGSHDWHIANCHIHHFSSDANLTGAAIWSHGCNNLLVDSCKINDVKNEYTGEPTAGATRGILIQHPSGSGAVPITGVRITNTLIENIKYSDDADGIALQGSDVDTKNSVLIDACVFRNCGKRSIKAQSPGLIVSDCDSYQDTVPNQPQNTSDVLPLSAFLIQRSRVKISDCRFSSTTGWADGIIEIASSSSISDVTITGNSFLVGPNSSTSLDAIDVETTGGLSGLIVSGNVFSGDMRMGVRLDGLTHGAVISSNTFKDLAGDPLDSGTDVSCIDGGSLAHTDLVISGNVYQNITGYFIGAMHLAKRLVVENNAGDGSGLSYTNSGFMARINPRETGASGDGTTDDAASLQRAVDAIASTGGTLVLEPRVYRVGKGIEVTGKKGFKIEGNGATIKFADTNSLLPSSVENRIIAFTFCEDLVVEEVTFDGNRDNRYQETAPGQDPMHNVQLGSGNRRVSFSSVESNNSLVDGFYIAGGQDDPSERNVDVIFNNCIALNNRRQGMSVICAEGVTVNGGSFSDTGHSNSKSFISSVANGGTDEIVVSVQSAAYFASGSNGWVDIDRSGRIFELGSNSLSSKPGDATKTRFEAGSQYNETLAAMTAGDKIVIEGTNADDGTYDITAINGQYVEFDHVFVGPATGGGDATWGNDGRYEIKSVDTGTNQVTLNHVGGLKASAIRSDNLSVLTASSGLAPRSGIDFEPNDVTGTVYPAIERTTLTGVEFSRNDGRGVTISATPWGHEAALISNCKFDNNNGALYIGGGTQASVSDCLFQNHSREFLKDGALIKVSSSQGVAPDHELTVFRNNRFVDNTAPHTSIYLQGTQVQGHVITGNLFKNSYGGVVCYANGTSITDNKFQDLTASTWSTIYASECNYSGNWHWLSNPDDSSNEIARGLYCSNNTTDSTGRNIISENQFIDLVPLPSASSSHYQAGVVGLAGGRMLCKNNVFRNTVNRTFNHYAIKITSVGDKWVEGNDVVNYGPSGFSGAINDGGSSSSVVQNNRVNGVLDGIESSSIQGRRKTLTVTGQNDLAADTQAIDDAVAELNAWGYDSNTSSYDMTKSGTLELVGEFRLGAPTNESRRFYYPVSIIGKDGIPAKVNVGWESGTPFVVTGFHWNPQIGFDPIDSSAVKYPIEVHKPHSIGFRTFFHSGNGTTVADTGHQGTHDASSSLPAAGGYSVGDWFEISVAGSGTDVGDLIVRNSSSAWDIVPADQQPSVSNIGRGDWVVLYSMDQLEGVEPHYGPGYGQHGMEIVQVADYNTWRGVSANGNPASVNEITNGTASADVPYGVGFVSGGVVDKMSRNYSWVAPLPEVIEGVVIKDITFSWDGSEDYETSQTSQSYLKTLDFNQCVDLKLDNVVIDRLGPGAISFDFCANVDAKVSISGSVQYDRSYGVIAKTCRDMIIDGEFKDTRHFFTTAASSDISTGSFSNVSCTGGTGVFNLTSHGLADGRVVAFSHLDSSENSELTDWSTANLKSYYVKKIDSDSFQLTSELNGSAITTNTPASGNTLVTGSRWGTPTKITVRGNASVGPKTHHGSYDPNGSEGDYTESRIGFDTHAEGYGIVCEMVIDVSGDYFPVNISAPNIAAQSRSRNTVFRNCIIRGSATYDYGLESPTASSSNLSDETGIAIYGSGCTVTGCVFENLARAVKVQSASIGQYNGGMGLTISNVSIEGSLITNSAAGIIVSPETKTDRLTIARNTFIDSGYLLGNSPYYQYSYIHLLSDKSTNTVVSHNTLDRTTRTDTDRYWQQIHPIESFAPEGEVSFVANSCTGYGSGTLGIGPLQKKGYQTGSSPWYYTSYVAHDAFYSTYAHNLFTGAKIEFTGTLPAEISGSGTPYYVIRLSDAAAQAIDTSTGNSKGASSNQYYFKVASSLANAEAGTAVAFTTPGSNVGFKTASSIDLESNYSSKNFTD